MSRTRQASHAGSWYTDDSSELNEQLGSWLRAANITEPACKALIGPHAGYSYSGPTAAWAYIHINPNPLRRVFLFGPSHHFYLRGCALPYSTVYATPIGNLPIDEEIVQELEKTGRFSKLSRGQEEDEHSLEMHLPYIRKAFEGKDVKLVPIMVGEMENEEEFGRIFAPYFRQSENLFVVSSDFCHWGQRFRYTPHDKSAGEIHQSIERMDREGMELIENNDVNGFKGYLERTKNTICGRNPIILLLSTILCAGISTRTRFVRYAQSEPVKKITQSSVSYASSVTSS